MKKYVVLRTYKIHNITEPEIGVIESKSLYSYDYAENATINGWLRLVKPILIATTDKDLELNKENIVIVNERDNLFEVEDDEAAKLIYEVT